MRPSKHGATPGHNISFTRTPALILFSLSFMMSHYHLTQYSHTLALMFFLIAISVV